MADYILETKDLGISFGGLKAAQNVNIRIKKDHMTILPPLVAAYFDQGGMQLQISCLSREDMIAAMNDPEKHRNLVVRIGGYSEYFTRLSPEMQKTVLARTEY